MREKLSAALTFVLVLCAICMTGLVAWHEVSGRRPRSDQQALVVTANWRDMLLQGDEIGPSTAAVHIVEFADFECPYCASFHDSLKTVAHKYSGSVTLTYVHFPLQGHRFAMPAERAAECARAQGRFEAMHDQLFEQQDQLGLKPWDDYATAAGVPDLAAFDICIKKTDGIPRVEQGKALGAKLDVRATPTLVINGWRLTHPPTADELEVMVKLILAGRSPVDGKS